jgi:FtsP/CotA-like multicopper oxidase with cupredoxin domain
VLGSVTQTGLALPGPDETRGEPAARPQRDLRTLPIDARRTMTFSEDSTSTKFYIDNKLFDHDRIDVRVPLGNVEEWTIRNQTQDFHEFHIHQIGFQVTEINGVKQDFAGLIDDADVPAMGEIKVILPFTDPIIVGKFMYHCHVLRHEDGGMMGQIEVYQRQATAAPAICHPPPETGGAPQFDRAIGLLAGSPR